MMSSVIIRYKECKRNHAISVGLHAVDGCREFMSPAAGVGGDQSGFLCAACGCHRNFHRKEIIRDGAVVHYGSSTTMAHAPPPPSSVVPMYVVVHQPPHQPPPPNVASFYHHEQAPHYHHQHHHGHHHGHDNVQHGDFEQKPNISFKTTKNEPF